MIDPGQAAVVRARVEELVNGLPEAVAEPVPGEAHVGCVVRGRRFAWLLHDHHGDGRLALNCKAAPGAGGGRVEADPERFFVPAYLGARGWVGLWLDRGEVDWSEVEGLLVEAYRLVAPKRLAAQLR